MQGPTIVGLGRTCTFIKVKEVVKSRSGKIVKVDKIAKQQNRKVEKSREDLGHRIWGIYEGSIAIRYGEAVRRISPRVIQLSKTGKES